MMQLICRKVHIHSPCNVRGFDATFCDVCRQCVLPWASCWACSSTCTAWPGWADRSQHRNWNTQRNRVLVDAVQWASAGSCQAVLTARATQAPCAQEDKRPSTPQCCAACLSSSAHQEFNENPKLSGLTTGCLNREIFHLQERMRPPPGAKFQSNKEEKRAENYESNCYQSWTIMVPNPQNAAIIGVIILIWWPIWQQLRRCLDIATVSVWKTTEQKQVGGATFPIFWLQFYFPFALDLYLI